MENPLETVGEIALQHAERHELTATKGFLAKISKKFPSWPSQSATTIELLARCGDFDAASEAAASISDDAEKSGTFRAIAEEMARRGDKEAARTTLMKAMNALDPIKELESSSQQLAFLALAQIHLGEMPEARETMNKVKGAITTLQTNQTEDNAQFIKHVCDCHLLPKVAICEAKLGLPSKAVATFRNALVSSQNEAPNDSCQGQWDMAEFCRALIDQGSASQMYEMMSALPDSFAKAALSVSIAGEILKQRYLDKMTVGNDSQRPSK